MSWRLERGDCLDLFGLASLPDKSVDHVITDPPYEAEAHTLQRRTNGKGHGRQIGRSTSKPLDFLPITESQRDDVAAQIGRVCKRWALVFCQIEAAMKWRHALEKAGLVYKRSCIWVKPDGQPQLTGDRPGMGYETIVACHAPGRSKWNGGGRDGVFRALRNDPDRTGHPTQKPDALMDMLTVLFTDPGETILDPFAGSGSTGVSAIRRGRNFIGWEMLDKYYAMALKRLSETREQSEMFARRPKPKQTKLFEVTNGKEESKEVDGVSEVGEGGSVSGDFLDQRSDEARADRAGEEGQDVAGGAVPELADRQREEGDPFDGHPEEESGPAEFGADDEAGW